MLMIILAANVAVFVAMVVGIGDIAFSARDLLRWGGNLGAVSLGGEYTGHAEWWRLFTATYLHASIMHILGNMALLLVAGRYVHARVGPVLFLVIYTLCGLAASLMSAWGHPEVVSIGASGAIAGIVGIVVVFALSGRFPDIDGRWVAQTVGINALYSLAPNVDWLAHLGGFLAGLAVGTVLLALPLAEPGRKA